MNERIPPLNALRAFEAAARHLSLTKAARELHVTAGALSHQIRGLEAFLATKLFERRVRAIALTQTGKLLYPGLQTGFNHINDAVRELGKAGEERVLVISTPPGFTAKWLVARLYRFADAYPAIDTRICSSPTMANFTRDGVDVAVRNLPIGGASDPALVLEKLIDLPVVPVCSPKLLKRLGSTRRPDALKTMPLIHDDTPIALYQALSWGLWFKEAGVEGVDVRRGLRFNSTDHALDAAAEGAGVLLAHDLLAYDELRTGRLVIAARLKLPPVRAYYLAYPKSRREHAPVQAFRTWLKHELAALDWRRVGKR
jgi:LysR family glycine cleavage system transcriptional activator